MADGEPHLQGSVLRGGGPAGNLRPRRAHGRVVPAGAGRTSGHSVAAEHRRFPGRARHGLCSSGRAREEIGNGRVGNLLHERRRLGPPPAGQRDLAGGGHRGPSLPHPGHRASVEFLHHAAAGPSEGRGAPSRAGHSGRALQGPVARDSSRTERLVQHRGRAHHVGFQDFRHVRSRRGLHRRRPVPSGRGHFAGQAEHAPVRLRPVRGEPRLRPHAQPVGTRSWSAAAPAGVPARLRPQASVRSPPAATLAGPSESQRRFAASSASNRPTGWSAVTDSPLCPGRSIIPAPWCGRWKTPPSP